MQMSLLLVLLFNCLHFISSNGNVFFGFLDYNNLNRGVFIDCGSGTILDTMKDFKHFFVHYVNLGNFNNISDVVALIDWKHVNVGVFVNLNCKNSTNFVQKASEAQILERNFWLLSSSNFNTSINILKDLTISINSDITLMINDTGEIIAIYELYKISGSALDRLIIVTHTKDFSKERKRMLPKVRRRENFLGTMFKAGVSLSDFNGTSVEILDYLESKQKIHFDTMQRKAYGIFKVLKDIFNFSTELVLTRDFGTKVNGTWNGVVGLALYGKTNFSITPLRYSCPRSEVLNYVPIKTHEAKFAFVFRQPRNIYLQNVFLEPFKTTVWIAIGALVFTVIVAIKWMSRFDRNRTLEISFSNLALIIFGALLLQGTIDRFRLLSNRILLYSILILAFLLQQFYSAFLLGSLLSEPPKKINTLEKLYNSQQLRIGMDEIAYSSDVLRFTKIGNKILENRILREPKKGNVVPIEEGLLQIKQGGFAFHVDILGSYLYLSATLTHREFCQLTAISSFQPIPLTLGFPKWSPFKEYLTNGILRMSEAGILDYHNKIWSSKTINCEQIQKSDGTQAVDLEHVLSLLAMLAFAIILSIVLLGIECLIFKCSAFI